MSSSCGPTTRNSQLSFRLMNSIAVGTSLALTAPLSSFSKTLHASLGFADMKTPR
jgi:hypothetical protein